MRNLRFFLLTMCAGLHKQASAQTFNARYDAWGRSDMGWSVELLPDSTYVIFSNSSYLDSLLYSSVVTSIRINANGEPLDTSRLILPERATYVGWTNASGPFGSGSGIIGGSTAALGDTNRATLYWYDQNGHISDQRELPLPGRSWIGRQAKQAPDGGYVLCGETSTVGYIDAFILKTDPAGILQWVKTYGGPSVDVASSIDMDASTGGYFMGGEWRQSNSDKQMWVQSLNDTGAVQWSKIWGSVYDEVQAHITTLGDGNILVASNWGTAVGNSVKYLAKLSREDGSIIWSHTYGNQCEGCLLLVGQEIEPGGDLIAVGHTLVPGSSYFGAILRTTGTGDSLWMRNYQYADDSVSNGKGLFSDVQPTPDGGFIAVGVALGIAGVYGQDVWVVKTDSMGCIEPGCNMVTGMETQITNTRDALRVYPNPVPQGGTLQLELNLPASFTPQGELKLTVVNSLGQLVETQAWHGIRQQLAIGQLPAGLYHLHLSDATRWISGGRFVVE
ncbi:MAG: T9SS type A sorting domain-containing protein [Flavobacteriales bacterium]